MQIVYFSLCSSFDLFWLGVFFCASLLLLCLPTYFVYIPGTYHLLFSLFLYFVTLVCFTNINFLLCFCLSFFPPSVYSIGPLIRSLEEVGLRIKLRKPSGWALPKFQDRLPLSTMARRPSPTTASQQTFYGSSTRTAVQQCCTYDDQQTFVCHLFFNFPLPILVMPGEGCSIFFWAPHISSLIINPKHALEEIHSRNPTNISMTSTKTFILLVSNYQCNREFLARGAEPLYRGMTLKLVFFKKYFFNPRDPKNKKWALGGIPLNARKATPSFEFTTFAWTLRPFSTWKSGSLTHQGALTTDHSCTFEG